jgi:hypothetical protein
MASKTTTDLATAVLRRLRVIDATETADASDASAIKALYADLYAEMKDEGVAVWPETAIPPRYFRALTDYVAGHAAVDFGKNDLVGLADNGESRLRRIAADDWGGMRTKAEFF